MTITETQDGTSITVQFTPAEMPIKTWVVKRYGLTKFAETLTDWFAERERFRQQELGVRAQIGIDTLTPTEKESIPNAIRTKLGVE